MAMRRLSVNPGMATGKAPASYPILIGKGLVDQAGPLVLPYAPNRKAAVVADGTAWTLHGERLGTSLVGAGIAWRVIVVPPGEGSKTIARLAAIWDELADFGMTRTDPVIAFGGGVVGDLAGFAAATYLRGIPVIQVPTTLLAQVDSSVGGKTAIDIARGKNLAGAFHQPSAVIVDPGLLDTLPTELWIDGFGEIVKHAAIRDRELFETLAAAKGPESLRDGIEDIVYRNLAIKADVISRDERESGERMILNFGHTIGHAVEVALGYGGLSHGRCVAIGMVAITRNSEALGATEPGTAEALVGAIRALRLPDAIPAGLGAGFDSALALDKKG
jgi:3-dehydroquinate synthase